MKKLVMKLLVSALAVFVVFGTKAAITNAYDAPTAQAEEYVFVFTSPHFAIVDEAIADELWPSTNITKWEKMKAIHFGDLHDECKPGSILHAGDEISFADVINNFDGIIFQYYLKDNPSVLI